MGGDGRTNTKMEVCGEESPHFPLHNSGRQSDKYRRVLCNRPYGHDGNHAWSDGRAARVAEWDTDGKVIR